MSTARQLHHSCGEYLRVLEISTVKLESLRAVLIISHREPRVTVVQRSGSGWVERDALAGRRVVVDDPALSFEVDELYRGVELDA